MAKHLRIEVNGMEYVNGDFAEITFTDGDNGVRLEARAVKAPTAAGGGGAGLLDLLASMSRNREAAAPTQPAPEPLTGEVMEPAQQG